MFLRRRTARLLALAAWCSFASPAACSAPAVEAPPTPSPPRPEPPATTSAAASSAPPPAPSAAPAPPRDPVDVEMEKVAALLATPLVSSDRKLVALFVGVESEGGDHITPLRILDVDTDRAVRSVRFARADAPEEKLARIAEARAALGERTWEATVAHPIREDDTAPKRVFALGEAVARMGEAEGLVVRFREPTLTVTDATGAPLLRRAYNAWSGHQTVGGQRCSVFADLSQVWGHRAAGVLVVEIRYSATPDFCSLPATTHVVRLPRK